MATTRSSSSRHYADTLWVSVSSPNLQKVLGILTDTADIDACVIERVRASVSSPNLRIVFGIARSGKALLRTKYNYLHQPSMVSSYTIVSICINLCFLYACHWFILLRKKLKDIYSCLNISLVRPMKNKQTINKSRLHECVLCVTGWQEENLSHARQRNHNIQSSRTKPSAADTLLCPEFVFFYFRYAWWRFNSMFFLTF